MKIIRGGIDIGSTTVKLVLLDERNNIIFGKYERHNADTQATLCKLLKQAKDETGAEKLRLKITGSGSINLGKALGIEFIQEVVAVATALKAVAPQTDVAIELGGEDAKIIYFEGGNIDERMNGVCAGGTGAFIDQMAALLQTDAGGLDAAAENYRHIYPIAARCGVFAKTDIQPLINEGATKEDLAASIFQAVVNQTISGLAQGKPIKGCVAFLGGPLHFMPQLKNAFILTLKLTEETTVDPENSHLFAAMGGALEAAGEITIDEIIAKLEQGVEIDFEMPRLPALFENEKDFADFAERHNKAVVPKADLATYSGNCYLGIDAGSTTTKLALIGEKGQLLYSFYSNNNGNPVETARKALIDLYKQLPETAKIAYSCSTGYGEELLKTAFCLDEGEVETIAHTTAAKFFQPQVDCVLDIGGQDMKCIKLKDGAVDSIMLNEACSSGCGSFIENFANSLGYTAAEFAKVALDSKNPVDLGTRCTVFMNSNVKQAQKEGARVSDISAGLAYSVIKNAIYKVIKLASAKDLGEYIVVQGGTFHNKAVLRAFENIVGVQVICPDISGIMGAFGAALLAKERRRNQATTTMSQKETENLTYKSTSRRCGGCSNNCMLTINTFGGGRHHITGNRCEKGSGNHWVARTAPNLVEYKRHRIFDYQPLENAPRGEIGIPRALNMYENFPFWATFFKELGFKVVLSPYSSRKIYEMGMDSIPSESECYPAKLTHGHTEWLIKKGVKTIFHPCVFYEKKETENARNNYNCPIVISYPENIKNNVESIAENQITYIRPFISFANEKTISDRMTDVCRQYWNIPANQVKAAVKLALAESEKVKRDLKAEAKKIIAMAEKDGTDIIVLAGRPYHIDPEINHGIPELIASYGLAVLTEDSLPVDFTPTRPLRVVDQWSFHSRLYTAAEFVAKHNNMQLIQLTSFGCGLDAVTSDRVAEILEKSGKLYTLLKIDEVNNLGAARIRIRSLISAINMRKGQQVKENIDITYTRPEFTKQMRSDGYTILAPQMSPIHFNILEPVFKKHGYNLTVLDNDNRSAIDTGLKYVNNDACYPSITVVGQIMEAVTSGRYDTNKLAIIMSQTGGCCRASNYIAFIRRALEKVDLSHIPVISLNGNGMETNEGFTVSPGLVMDAVKAVIYGDLIMRCLYRTRPYEKAAGSANKLHKDMEALCIDSLTNPKPKHSYKETCKIIADSFDTLEIDETARKPRVGVVGEILVKYMPLANNHIVELLEKEGAEAVVPDLIDFFNYSVHGNQYKAEFLGGKKSSAFTSKAIIALINEIRKPAINALKASKRFDRPVSIYETAEMTKPFLSLGNQYGEGWFLTGEMIELISHGTPNIVCIQPFACLPNHVVGKGVIKAIKKEYPQANIAAVDYDPGASEVNQLNRIKLMLASAKANL